MVLLDGHHPILQHAGGLDRDAGDPGWVQRKGVQQMMGDVEKMQHELEPGIGCEMNPVGLELRGSEARHQEHVLGTISENLRELRHDFWKTIAVPQGSLAVHWRSNEVENLSLINGSSTDGLKNLAKNRIDTKRDRGAGLLSAGQKVGQARQPHDVGLRPH